MKIRSLQLGFRDSGFTIVELLIVVVVIAILASITIVSFNGIQSRAEISKIKSDFRAIEQSMALYKSQTGKWPTCPLGDDGWSECKISEIASVEGVTGMPRIDSGRRDYVAGNIAGRWAVQFEKRDGSWCKVGFNYDPSWWGGIPACW